MLHNLTEFFWTLQQIICIKSSPLTNRPFIEYFSFADKFFIFWQLVFRGCHTSSTPSLPLSNGPGHTDCESQNIPLKSKNYLNIRFLPTATHVKFTASPRCTVWFLGARIITGGPRNQNYWHLKNMRKISRECLAHKISIKTKTSKACSIFRRSKNIDPSIGSRRPPIFKNG